MSYDMTKNSKEEIPQSEIEWLAKSLTCTIIYIYIYICICNNQRIIKAIINKGHICTQYACIYAYINCPLPLVSHLYSKAAVWFSKRSSLPCMIFLHFLFIFLWGIIHVYALQTHRWEDDWNYCTSNSGHNEKIVSRLLKIRTV